MKYIVGFNIFDKKGNQVYKEVSRKTIKGLLSAIEKFDNENEIYQVISVSSNLVDVQEVDNYLSTLGW